MGTILADIGGGEGDDLVLARSPDLARVLTEGLQPFLHKWKDWSVSIII